MYSSSFHQWKHCLPSPGSPPQRMHKYIMTLDKVQCMRASGEPGDEAIAYLSAQGESLGMRLLLTLVLIVIVGRDE